jgi:hypothetical protein
MAISNFKPVWLGQCIGKYQVPWHLWDVINKIYEENFHKLPSASKQLIGKIKKEHSLYHQGDETEKMHKHNLLSRDVLVWLSKVFECYLDFLDIKEYKLFINSVWVNEMKANEYNPIHLHQGTMFTGLSSVMVLKMPKDMGPEPARNDRPMNGRLHILGNDSGYFCKSDYLPVLQERDFYIFPYDVRHCVYPFTSDVTRRTLSANVDVAYSPIATRGIT